MHILSRWRFREPPWQYMQLTVEWLFIEVVQANLMTGICLVLYRIGCFVSFCISYLLYCYSEFSRCLYLVVDYSLQLANPCQTVALSLPLPGVGSGWTQISQGQCLMMLEAGSFFKVNPSSMAWYSTSWTILKRGFSWHWKWKDNLVEWFCNSYRKCILMYMKTMWSSWIMLCNAKSQVLCARMA